MIITVIKRALVITIQFVLGLEFITVQPKIR